MKRRVEDNACSFEFLDILKYTETCFLIHKTHEEITVGMFSVPARISKGQGAGPEKGSLVRCWIFKNFF